MFLKQEKSEWKILKEKEKNSFLLKNCEKKFYMIKIFYNIYLHNPLFQNILSFFLKLLFPLRMQVFFNVLPLERQTKK